jgi:ABC-2 type transport system ATP-binding protein
MIEVRSLTRRFGALKAVDAVTFTVEKGEVLGFLGPNGAGKTTTMRILTGALGATEGEVKVAGFDMRTHSRSAREQIGYLPELPPVYRSMRVRSYLDYAARLRRVPGRERKAKVQRAIERAGLTDVAGRLIDHLSKGYRQRLGVAQAIVHEPALLILDEPTAGLDPAQVAEIRSLINELRGDHTIVLSTHILGEVRATCDRVLIINRGQRIAGPATEDELRRFLGAGRRIQLELARPSETTRAALAAVEGVEDIEDAGEGRFVAVTGHDDVREQVNAAAAPFGLLESRSEGGLEELYLKAVAEDPAVAEDGEQDEEEER